MKIQSLGVNSKIFIYVRHHKEKGGTRGSWQSYYDDKR